MKNETLLRNLLQKMPPYCKQFFIGIEPTTSSRTRIAYAYDLNCFFDYLHENIHYALKKDITEIPHVCFGQFSAQWILKNIGMDKDELLRLKQVSGLAELFANKDFSISDEL